MNNNDLIPHLGEVYIINFSGSGSVQSGIRPAVVLQNDTGNRFSPNVTVLPMTSKIKKAGQPTHVLLKAEECGLNMDSMVLCENPVCISKDRMIHMVTKIPTKYMKEIARATVLAMGISYLVNI